MPHRLSLANVALLLAILLAVSACTTVETQSFRVPEASRVESAQIAADADFGRYDRLQAQDMGIFFPRGSATTPEDIERIRAIFRAAFIAELEGYTIVGEAGPTTMKVEASLIDLRNASADTLPSLRRDVQQVAQSGSLVFLMELKDSETDRVLGRAADSAEAPVFATSAGTSTDWTSVENAAGRWATIFREFLDANLAR